MKRIAFAFIPLLLAGFMLPDDSCRKKDQETPLPQIGNGNGDRIDGPYVSYTANNVMISTIYDSLGTRSVKLDSFALADRAKITLAIPTDDSGITFNVTLKPQLENEKNEFSNINKRFILSDIEGNFSAFKKLLQGAQVIDSNYNWVFGNGHLVLTGDFVDRGAQQTEVLWLIYSLEEKAKAAGGYVHYILGNHEIMNLNGDLRYLHAKYQATAVVMGQSWPAIYGENTELGRWLRTKNVIEKVDDILFCHAGVSSWLNNRDIGVNKINKLVKPFYADSSGSFKNSDVEKLYSDLGPFWYRGYYYGVKAFQSQIDSTLSIFKVSKIATGHTVIADTISVLYNGKVINTDVHHLKGHTEGILIEEGNYYRVKPSGEKFPLMIK